MTEEEQIPDIEAIVNEKLRSGQYTVRPKDSQSQQTTYTAQDIFRGSLSPEYRGTDVAPDTVIESDATATGIDPGAAVPAQPGIQPSANFTQLYNALALKKILAARGTVAGGYPGIMPGEHDAGKPPPPVGVWDNLKALAQKPGFQKFAGTLATAALGGPDRGRDVAEFTAHWNQMQAATAAERKAEQELKRQRELDKVNKEKFQIQKAEEARAKQTNALNRLQGFSKIMTPQEMVNNAGFAQLFVDAEVTPGTDLRGPVYVLDEVEEQIRLARPDEEGNTWEVTEANRKALQKKRDRKKPWEEVAETKLAFLRNQLEPLGLWNPEVEKRAAHQISDVKDPADLKKEVIRHPDGSIFLMNLNTGKWLDTGLKVPQLKPEEKLGSIDKVTVTGKRGLFRIRELYDIVAAGSMLDYVKSGVFDRQVQVLRDHVVDQIGRLRSGGAITADEEARFLTYLAVTWMDLGKDQLMQFFGRDPDKLKRDVLYSFRLLENEFYEIARKSYSAEDLSRENLTLDVVKAETNRELPSTSNNTDELFEKIDGILAQ